MSTYQASTLVTRVQQRIADTGYSTAEILQYINDTQNDIFNEYRLPFMENSAPYTLTIGNSDLTHGTGLPLDYVQAIDVSIGATPGGRVLTYVDYRTLDRSTWNEDPNATVNNIPQYWYYFAETIRLYPTPNTAYAMTLQYYAKPTELTADADVPSIPSEFGEVLVVGAAYRVMQAKDNYDQAAILQNKYDEILDKLVYKYSVHQVGTASRMRINRRRVGRAYF